MKTYARVDNGIVMEIISPAIYPDGTEIPIEERFVPSLVAQMIDITNMTPQPDQGWTYDGANFAPYAPPVLSPEQIAAVNTAQQSYLIAQASNAMAPVLVSLQLGDATDAETTLARAWQTYYRALQAVDVTQVTPDWPIAPDAA